jgi:hypothetical protein
LSLRPRPARALVHASITAAILAAMGPVSCNSALGLNDLQIGARCGAGTTLVNDECIAAADPKAPSFGGAISLSAVSATSLLVSWDAAVSPSAPAEELRYSVFLATTKGGEDFNAPEGVVTGATSFALQNLKTGTEYFVVVRASDKLGHQEANTLEIHATAQVDTTPPVFAGVASAVAAPGGKVSLSWGAATDDLSGSAAITYVVYGGETAPVVDSVPLATVTGATSATVLVPKPLTPYRFVVRAQDATGNQEKNTHELVSTAGADGEPPDFGGCTVAMGVESNQVNVGWIAAHDDITPEADVWYDVYAFATPGPHADPTAAVAQKSAQGQLSVTIGNLAADTTYYFVCRARDLSGNVGGNPATLSGATLKDTTPPDFPGAPTAAPVSLDSYEITVKWAPAVDIQTPPDKIAYDIFTAGAAGAEDFALPPAQTTTGQTQATLLVRPGEKTYLVVRARDEAQNLSTSLQEINVTPHISYDWQIQPIFTRSCVTGCHDVDQKSFNPILAGPVSYTFITSEGIIDKGHADTSWLYQDMACPAPGCLPAPGSSVMVTKVNPMPQTITADHIKPTTAEVQLIHDWIDEGAAGPLVPGPGVPPGYLP